MHNNFLHPPVYELAYKIAYKIANKIAVYAMASAQTARISAPGAARLELCGQLLTCDDFGRLRLLLLRESPAGERDQSHFQLRAACAHALGMSIAAAEACARLPYASTDAAATAAMAATTAATAAVVSHPVCELEVATVTVVIPKRYTDHWAATAARLRGRYVRVTVGLRRFHLAGKPKPYGVSLDLQSIDE